MTPNFDKNILIKGAIVCETGLHIGASTETIDIGGIDAFVIRDIKTGRPYIPGSSLKGKMRSLLELKYDKYIKQGKRRGASCDCGECDICVTFGHANKEKETGPTRLIVRDIKLTNPISEETVEIKGENWINRITSAADPRFIERVPAGSEFKFEMIYSVYQTDYFPERLKLVFEGMNLLEDNYIGASGSRGYGKIRFKDIELKQKIKEDYINGGDWTTVDGTDGLKTTQEILKWLNELDNNAG